MGHIHQAWFSCVTQMAFSICLLNLNSHCRAMLKMNWGEALFLSTVCFNKYGEKTVIKGKCFCYMLMS